MSCECMARRRNGMLRGARGYHATRSRGSGMIATSSLWIFISKRSTGSHRCLLTLTLMLSVGYSGLRTREGRRKRKSKGTKQAQEYDFEDEELDSDDESSSAYTNSSFYLPQAAKPTPSTPTWAFRWRGEEREGPICIGSDEYPYQITFEEPKGTKLSGSFGGFDCGDCTFTGTKVEMAHSYGRNINYEWSSYSQRRYDEAAQNRWR